MKYHVPLALYLESSPPQNTCLVYKLTVGGEDYIGFTSQNSEMRLEQHIESAKQGSKLKVHVALRRFGYLNKFEVIGTYESEVLALVREISEIKRLSPALNMSLGGEGNTIDLVEKKNDLGELIFFVIDKNERDNHVLKKQGIEDNKQSEKNIILRKFQSAKNQYRAALKENRLSLSEEFYRELEVKFPLVANLDMDINHYNFNEKKVRIDLKNLNKRIACLQNGKQNEAIRESIFTEIENKRIKLKNETKLMRELAEQEARSFSGKLKRFFN